MQILFTNLNGLLICIVVIRALTTIKKTGKHDFFSVKWLSLLDVKRCVAISNSTQRLFSKSINIVLGKTKVLTFARHYYGRGEFRFWRAGI
jgi:hypothetical protein